MKHWILITVAACAACGGSDGNPDGGSTPPNGVSGSVDGGTLNVQDAIFTIASSSALDVPDGTVVVVLGDRANLCSFFESTTLPTGNITALALYLAKFSFTGLEPLTTGSYAFFSLSNPPTNVGSYWSGFFVNGPACDPTEYDPTAGSALSLTQVGTATGTHLKATFSSLTFAQGTLTNGTIDASYCAALNNPSNACLTTPPAPLRRVPLPGQ
jgi:hypothetical protein